MKYTPHNLILLLAIFNTVDLKAACNSPNANKVTVEITKPTGDPSTTAGANTYNERTYSSASTPTVTVVCSAKDVPQEDEEFLRWTIEDVGSIKAKWNPHVDGDEYTGKGENATATYTGMPNKYDDFGKKKITLTLEGGVSTEDCKDETYVEIFFPKTAKNHPGTGSGTTPNWFFYWLQTVTPLGNPAPSFKYGTSSYFTPGTTEITLSDGDVGSYSAPYVTNNPLCGIDNFAWTVIHESQHYKDWVDLWGNNYTKWFNTHKGNSGASDDKDGDRIPNKTEDVNLNGSYDTGDLYDWSAYNTPTTGRPASIINDFEDWNCQRNKSATGDHKKDWSNPGMQHKTIGKYND